MTTEQNKIMALAAQAETQLGRALKAEADNSVLRSAIRRHRDQKADDRCIEDDDALYEVLGDGIRCDRRVGNKEEMLANCKRFIERRCEGGHWPAYQELELRIATLERRVNMGEIPIASESARFNEPIWDARNSVE